MPEFLGAVAGHNKANRIGPDPMTRAEFDDLADRYADPRSLAERRKDRKRAKHGR